MGRIIKGTINITLKSDLCAGSGYSYAGMIDSDSCYDEYGLPYIPARRLKGCIRESIEELLYTKYPPESHIVEKCFGKTGSDSGSSFMLGNAYITGYESIRADLEAHKSGDRPEYEPQVILGRFSHISGQTKMEKGVAEEGSLRYTRVVNRYSPVTGGELQFKAELLFDEDYSDLIKDGVRATRHIGLKRNRGLGNVSMELKSEDCEKASKRFIPEVKQLDDGRYCLSFAIRNSQPLMISGDSEDESLSYIPGQQILGLLAGRYLREGNSPDTEEFKALFLNGDVEYSNLYPFDGKSIYYPAPEYLNRLKKTKKYVYTIGSTLPDKDSLDKEFNYENGNQPKKLKGKYSAIKTDNRVSVMEVERDVVYHHSKQVSDNGEQGILYSMEVIKEGQVFAGHITSRSQESLNKVVKLLTQGDLSIGKSKTAQYGRCRLVEFETANTEVNEKISPQETLLVTFRSDAIIYNDYGLPTVYLDEVKDKVARELGITDCLQDDNSSEQYMSCISTKTLTGYLGVWNLRKPVVPAVKAGSYITYKIKPGANISLHKDNMVGERNLEGYGQVHLDNAKGFTYAGPVEDKIANDYQSLKPSKETVDLIRPVIYDQWLERKINRSMSDTKLNISNTAAGRMALMLKESLVEGKDPDDAFKLFAERICSFKTGNTRSEGEKLLKLLGSRKESWESGIDSQCYYLEDDQELTEALEHCGISVDEAEKKKRWDKYVMAILVNRKYEGR